ncbi:helix-turn-helix domain-containing protein [Halobium salinum]|uniref:Helix-turn-helix domain-containing protein n=1 Tax=Halobium salinum TaxID=1364940 RepID=A0ABD5P908_9EURY|nr:helix-turn-helix domain-containing protein [Halobium salinum]
MPVVTDISLSGDSFPLGHLLELDDSFTVEFERLVPTGNAVLPFFWVPAGSVDAAVEALDDRSLVASVEVLTEVENRALLQVEWTDAVNGVVDALLETDGAIVSGKAVRGSWKFRLRFPDHYQLRQFTALCTESDVAFDVEGVYNPHPPGDESRLTSVQWDTLMAAHEKGYFEVPRRATLSDLAAEFDVSEQAISQRLRRAMNVVVAGLAFGESDAPGA